MKRRIFVRFVEKPRKTNIDSELKWLCNSLGVCSGRDTENISLKIFENIINRYHNEFRLSTEMIAKDLTISPNRVNHHIRNMINMGLFYRDKKKIFLRGGSVKRAIEEMKKDSDRMFSELIQIADKIDEKLGLD